MLSKLQEISIEALPLGKFTWTLERLSVVVVSPRLILDFGISQRPLFCYLILAFKCPISLPQRAFYLLKLRIHAK